jgi:hypothetical protein
MKANAKNLVVVSKETQKELAKPFKRLTPKETAKATSRKVSQAKTPNVVKAKAEPKAKQKSYHNALLECNKLDKAENFSLSGALNRLKKQIFDNVDYKGINPDVLNSALTFDNLLANVNPKCIEKQRFTVYALGLAVNKYLKNALK